MMLVYSAIFKTKPNIRVGDTFSHSIQTDDTFVCFDGIATVVHIWCNARTGKYHVDLEIEENE